MVNDIVEVGPVVTVRLLAPATPAKSITVLVAAFSLFMDIDKVSAAIVTFGIPSTEAVAAVACNAVHLFALFA